MKRYSGKGREKGQEAIMENEGERSALLEMIWVS